MSRIFLAYLATWNKFDIASMPAEKLTHVCYAFANICDSQVVLAPSLARGSEQLAQFEDKFKQLQTLKLQNAELKIMISIGGWGAEGFSDAALNQQSRQEFARSAVQFMCERQLDGIDLDWEYPSNAMAGIKARTEDKGNFSLLLEEVRQALDRQSDLECRQGSARYQLSIAAGAGQYYLDGVEIERVAQTCDFINLMTYDFYNGWATKAGHHANLYCSSLDPTGDSVDSAVQLFIDHGVSPAKLVLGCPLYGRSLKGVGRAGLGALGQAGSNAAPGFHKIMTELLPSNRFVRHWDEAAQAPWLFDGDEFISYEDCESIERKGRYAKQLNLAGVMFWELSDDHHYALLNALHDGFYS
ncbi:glycoside hydrolase family 18 protein [Chitinibacter sp. SCUT-21]|uniref:glycoside hydrolase family 18 protein n=1 Tax=Chitinibacter sp. SCUT-21 TaxID=2970891 RepID=UPI0035A6B655